MINHIGFIMDGNRRYANKNGLTKEEGYKIGMEQFLNIVKLCINNNIKHCSFFSMSKDNIEKRDTAELEPIKNLAKEFYERKEIRNFFIENSIRIELKGKIVNKSIEDIEEYTKNKNYELSSQDLSFIKKLKEENEKLKSQIPDPKNFVYLALNYDGQEEIAEACNNLIEKGEKNITPEMIKKEIYFNDTPPADIIVRPGDAPRTSGFLLFDSKYSEIYLTKKLWPELNKEDITHILDWYSNIKRNFGK